MIPNFFNVGWLGSLGSLLFPSLYESRQDLTTVQKSWFVEWFSGKSLRSIWTQRNLRTGATFAMADSIDGGFTITGTGGTNEGCIDFNGIRHYSNTGSTIICVAKCAPPDLQRIDLIHDHTQVADSGMLDYAGILQNGNNFYLSTGNASASNNALIMASDSNTHKFKLVLGASSASATIDDAHLTTYSGADLPTQKLQPRVVEGNGTATLSIKYLEVYNT